jgi:hypothetical protein
MAMSAAIQPTIAQNLGFEDMLIPQQLNLFQIFAPKLEGNQHHLRWNTILKLRINSTIQRERSIEYFSKTSFECEIMLQLSKALDLNIVKRH